MTPLVPEGTEPVGVWDTRRRNFAFWAQQEEASAWAAEHLSRPGDTYRAEFYLIDAPFAVLYRYHRNEEGFLHRDPATAAAAVEEPVLQVLDELPPAHLLGAP